MIMKSIKINFGENPHVLPLDFLPYSKGSKWFSVYRSLDVELSNGDRIIIPAGFETDLASVPKFLWSFFPPFGDDLIAYIIHDYLYGTKFYDRKFSDKEMYLWAKAIRKDHIDPYLRYVTVRMFGSLVWDDVIKL